jgi:hypothetical protein
MSEVLETPEAARGDPAATLRTQTAAMRLSFAWFGVRKTLSPEQKAEAAETFGAESPFLSAAKRLLDTRDPAFRAVGAVKNQAVAYFKGSSLPYPEPGIRLVRQRDLSAIDERMQELRGELAQAVDRLDERYAELKRSARDRLGRLYAEGDYPASLAGLFAMDWDFPSVEPPDYLRQLNPELYRQECERARARFDEAVQLAESAFCEELAKLVEHLSERLSGEADGKPKIFRDSAVTNLEEFFDRFAKLSVRSSPELDALVARARSILGGVEPQPLRESAGLRTRVANQLAGVQASLDQLLVDRPRRNILRRPR